MPSANMAAFDTRGRRMRVGDDVVVASNVKPPPRNVLLTTPKQFMHGPLLLPPRSGGNPAMISTPLLFNPIVHHHHQPPTLVAPVNHLLLPLIPTVPERSSSLFYTPANTSSSAAVYNGGMQQLSNNGHNNGRRLEFNDDDDDDDDDDTDSIQEISPKREQDTYSDDCNFGYFDDAAAVEYKQANNDNKKFNPQFLPNDPSFLDVGVRRHPGTGIVLGFNADNLTLPPILPQRNLDTDAVTTAARSLYSNVNTDGRIILGNMVFIRYIPGALGNKDFLWHLLGAYGPICRMDFMGPFDALLKTFLPRRMKKSHPDGEQPCDAHACIVLFADWRGACRAINAIDKRVIEVHKVPTNCFDPTYLPYWGPDLFELQAMLGAYAYCRFFVRGEPCMDVTCRGVHEVVNAANVYSLGEIRDNKHGLYEKQLQQHLKKQAREWDKSLNDRYNELQAGRCRTEYESILVKYAKFRGPKQVADDGFTLLGVKWPEKNGGGGGAGAGAGAAGNNSSNSGGNKKMKK